MSEQDRTQVNIQNRSTNNNPKVWKAYWMGKGQSWRTEPEIDVNRQAYLDERRKIKTGWMNGVFPFKDIELNRADVEWLLATHENGRGPIDWSDESQRERKGLDLLGANLVEVDMDMLPLTRAILTGAHLERASLHSAKLEGVDLTGAYLEGTRLSYARLYRALLIEAHLNGADLNWAFLAGADLSRAYFDGETKLNGAELSDNEYGGASLVDIHWDGVNLAVVDWLRISTLGHERKARIPTFCGALGETIKNKNDHLKEYQTAVRAYRQLAVALQGQALNEEAAKFAYRAQLLKRKVYWYGGIRKFGRYLFLLFLDLLAGYGYKPWRSFAAYLIVILGFAIAYFFIGQTVGPFLSPVGSVVFSMTSFHGRGFFPGGIKLDDPLTILAAFEAFGGLLIEVVFIATLTRRLFEK